MDIPFRTIEGDLKEIQALCKDINRIGEGVSEALAILNSVRSSISPIDNSVTQAATKEILLAQVDLQQILTGWFPDYHRAASELSYRLLD